MSGREWKPGDVALAKHPIADGEVRGIIDTDGRFYTTDQSLNGISSSAFAVSNLRPPAVIDPEDREQVERLSSLAEANGGPRFGERGVDSLAAALREFANPLPPKPDEPTGLGAVVEDAEGKRWVRGPGGHWTNLDATGAYLNWSSWEDMNAFSRVVKVLSNGATA